MPPEDTGEENVDRGDDYVAPQDAGKQEELPLETTENQDEQDSGDLDLGDTDTDTDTGDTEKAAAADSDDTDAGEAAKVRDEKGRFIPKERFDEAVQREREEKERVATRLAELEKREADRAVSEDLQEASAKIKELIGEHTQLISDGELEKASDKMEEMLQLQGDMQARRAEAVAQQSSSQAKSEIQYDAVVAKLEIDYPEINPEDPEHFDREAVRRVQAYMTGLINMEGMSPSKALQESVTTILGAKRAEEKADEKSAEEKAEEAAAMGMRRKEAAVTKNVETQKKQPADLKDVGQDHDKEGGPLDASAVMKMSWEEFVKLPEEKLSEMRGDHMS